MTARISIFAYTQKNYAAAIRSTLGKGYDHACLIYSEWYRKGTVSGNSPAFKNAQKLLKAILELTDFSLPDISKRVNIEGTEKFLLRLPENYEIEAVVIPMKFGHSLCVSSQVGCQMGCTFCQTGRMGLIRNLTVEEIVSQLFTARTILGYPVRNVVFMGMGEPMDNFDAVKQAIEIFSDDGGFGLGKSHITVSTSGRIDGIRRMIREFDPAINLAISINAPNDAVRTKLMPINRKYDMTALRQVLDEYCQHPRRSLLAEYILIKGYTDGLSAAEELAHYLKGLKVKINLIPYNPQNPDRYERPEESQIEAFAEHLRQKGFHTLFRSTKGKQIMAACGQLGNLQWKKTRAELAQNLIHNS